MAFFKYLITIPFCFFPSSKPFLYKACIRISKIIEANLLGSHLNYFLLIFFIIISITLNAPFVFAAEKAEIKITKLENKISRNITRKFCNSLGFGLSKESSIKFAVRENNKEMSNKNLYELIDNKEIADQLAVSIVENCGTKMDLFGQKGIYEFKSYLNEIDILSNEDIS